MDKPSSIPPKQSAKLKPYWITVRKIVQYLVLAGFIGLFFISQQNNPGMGLIDYFLRLDPLLVLTSMVASRTFLITSGVEFILAILLAVVAGRAWCGWLCPLGSVLDIFFIKKTYANKIPESFRSIKYGILLVILVAAFFGNLTFLFFDPLTIFYRSLTLAILPGLNQIITAIETLLFTVPALQDPLSWIDGIIRPNILPLSLQYFYQSILFGCVFFGVIALNALAPRFWCRYLCPLGGFLGLIAKVSIFRREVGENCRDCALCSKRCPTGTINPAKGFASDPGECTLCLECFKNCQDSTITAHSPLPPAEMNSYDPGRRQLLFSAAAAVAGVALFQNGADTVHPNLFLLRPPGSNDDQILSTCLRCGACMRACPTNIIQPAGFDLGLERLWTPLLIPELGYCEFTCNTCGQVCPVQAIPNLPLEEKQVTVIGKAFIDQNRCIAWSDHKPCMVCEEMCPLPEKAVLLTDINVIDPDGTNKTIKAPQVNRSRCIGCGVCEFKCPVIGEAAIRVRNTSPTLYLI